MVVAVESGHGEGSSRPSVQKRQMAIVSRTAKNLLISVRLGMSESETNHPTPVPFVENVAPRCGVAWRIDESAERFLELPGAERLIQFRFKGME